MLATALLAVPAASGQEQPATLAPFFTQVTTAAPGPQVSLELEAKRALELGLPAIAVELYQRIFDDPATTPTVRNRVAIGLSTALLEEDRIDEAGRVLQRFVGLPTPALRLRQAMVAVRERRIDAARAEAQALTPDELDAQDRGWLFFLRGLLADEARDGGQAGSFYQQAIEAAGASSLQAQRAWFVLARERAKLILGTATENDLATLRQMLERNAGRAAGYSAVSQLAVGLSVLGRRPEAIALLQGQLQALPPQERQTNDEWRLLLGVIAGADQSAGRIALRGLLENSSDRDRQRAALRLLARVSRTGASREDFRALLDQLMSSPTPHPILEDLLLVRAQTALSEKSYSQAENDANRLLTEFPGSPLKAAALGVLTESAWEQGFYRKAATEASKARAELPAGETRAQLGVLVAEAYFRAAEFGKSSADYRTAADAYGAALAEVPAGISAGKLIFQRVLAAVRAGLFDDAERMLDELAGDPRLDPVSRWQAEWNLSRALQVADETAKAYARVNRLLDTSASAGLSADLRASMTWLQARLSFETGEYTRTLTLADGLARSLDGVEAGLKNELASTALLLHAQAGFALNQPTRKAEALERLKKLRADFPDSDAAAYSYIVEADAAESVVEAQQLMQNLADRFSRSPYAPYALYRAALYAERRAANPEYYRAAYNILEDLVKNYPQSEFVFYARLKQGNLLRLLGEDGRALTLYADVVNKYQFPEFQDALAAQIAQADLFAALAPSDRTAAGSAAEIYGRLYDQQAAPLDLRVEAGHKLGLSRSTREGAERAYAVWWPMTENFLRDDTKAVKLGAKGRYWMARTVVKLGELLEREGKTRQARELYELLLEKGLDGAGHAREGIARTGGKG